MYCKNCGNLIKENERFCSKCGMNVSSSVNSNVVSDTNSNRSNQRPKKSFIKRYLKLVGCLCLLFFIMTFLQIVLRIMGINNNVISRICSFIAIVVPIYGIVFGWLVILIYDSIRGNK